MSKLCGKYEPGCIIAVDPGSAHVGVAVWTAHGGAKAKEVAAEKFLPIFAKIVVRADAVVIEKFVLYPSKARAQSWSPMATSEMIGAMRWIAREKGVLVAMQGADIKIPTRRQCVARGINVKHKSPHAADALLHLYYFLLRHELVD